MRDGDAPADRGPTVDMDVSSEHGALAQDDVVGDIAIVCDVGAGHEVAIAADPCVPVFLYGGAVDCDVFSNDVSVAHHDMGFGAGVADVLWLSADDRPGRNLVVLSDFHTAQHGDRIDQNGASADFDIGSDDTEWTDFHIGTDLSVRMNIGQFGDSWWFGRVLRGKRIHWNRVHVEFLFKRTCDAQRRWWFDPGAWF